MSRRAFAGGCGATLAFALAGTTPDAVMGATQEGPAPIEQLLADAPKDWGRFGEDDELGRLNLLGSEEAFAGLRAASKRGAKRVERFTLQLSQTGEVIDSATDTGDPAFPPRTPGRRDNTTAVEPEPSAGGMKFVDDKFVADFFLQGTTHVDALGHAWYAEQIYNGYSARTTETRREFDTPLLGTTGRDSIPDNGDPEDLTAVSETRGLSKADVAGAADEGFVGRGVLLDVGRALDVGDDQNRLPSGYGVTLEDLQTTADQQGTEIRDRDILLVRTGSIERTRDPDAEWDPLGEPGLVYSEELVEFLADRDIPYVGADNLAVEKAVQQLSVDGEDQTFVIPLHGALLRNLGIYLNEILDLRELGAACAADGIYEFLFTAAPLNVERASGSPVNPVVVKAAGGPPDEAGGRGRGND